MHFLWASGEYSRHKLVRHQAGRSWEAGLAQHAPSPPLLLPLPCFCPETHWCRGVGLQGQCWRSLQGQVIVKNTQKGCLDRLLSSSNYGLYPCSSYLFADLQLNTSVWQLLATAGMWSDVTGEWHPSSKILIVFVFVFVFVLVLVFVFVFVHVIVFVVSQYQCLDIF